VTVTGTVKDVLSQKGTTVWSIPAEASVYQAVERMAEHDIGALLVETDGEVFGVISERDYTRKVVLRGRSSKTTRVRDILSTALVVVRPNTPIAECMQLMTARHIRHVPVVEGRQVVGLVSMGDLVQWLISAQGFAIDRLEEYILGIYPA
jgi:CBS domain-containing protein